MAISPPGSPPGAEQLFYSITDADTVAMSMRAQLGDERCTDVDSQSHSKFFPSGKNFSFKLHRAKDLQA